MEPNFQRLLDEMTGITRRFDDQDAKFTGRFDTLGRSLAARDVVLDTRIGDLSRRLSDLEAAPTDPQVNAVGDRVSRLEGRFVDRDAEFDSHILDLESLRTAHIKDERDARVEDLESVTKELCEWRTSVDGTLDDIRLGIGRLERANTHEVLEEMPPGVILMPATAAVHPSVETTATTPVVGHRDVQTPRDQGPGVVTT